MEKEPKTESAKNSVWESWKTSRWIRLAILALATAIGLIITPLLVPSVEYLINWISGVFGAHLSGNIDSIDSSSRFRVNLSLLVMSLPVLLVLWWFRTYDTRQQIEKSQQQVEASVRSSETNTRDSLLAIGLQLIASDSVAGRGIGLVQLALVRSRSHELENHLKKQLEDQIDASTQRLILYGEESGKYDVIVLRGAMLQNLNLRGTTMMRGSLEDADLEGADLRQTNLREMQLQSSNLQEVNLEDADLSGAYLKGAQLKGARLKGARLDGAQLAEAHLEGAHVRGAYYDEATTSLPPGFDAKKEGLIQSANL